jgi:hypothetical protein
VDLYILSPIRLHGAQGQLYLLLYEIGYLKSWLMGLYQSKYHLNMMFQKKSLAVNLHFFFYNFRLHHYRLKLVSLIRSYILLTSNAPGGITVKYSIYDYCRNETGSNKGVDKC